MGKATTRVPMSTKMRAKQFAMFDALKGLTEAIAEKEQQSHPRKELSEDRKEEINCTLKTITKGDFVTVVYYCQYGKQYRQFTGCVADIDNYWKTLQFGAISIGFDEIFDINKSTNAEGLQLS